MHGQQNIKLGHCLVLTLGVLQNHSVKHGIKIPGKNLVKGKPTKSSIEVDGRWKFLSQEGNSATPSNRSLGKFYLRKDTGSYRSLFS
jgi:hypothetical protein